MMTKARGDDTGASLKFFDRVIGEVKLSGAHSDALRQTIDAHLLSA